MEQEKTLVEKFQTIDNRWYCEGCPYTNLCDCCKIRNYAVEIMEALKEYEKEKKKIE